MSEIRVNVDNFARAETDRMFRAMLPLLGRVGNWHHDREFAPLDQQPVIRQNRDTLYSVALADISQGGVLRLPDSGDRYMSAMVVNQDHYIHQVFHGPGEHLLDRERFGSPFVCLGVRILVDPHDPDDLAVVHDLQDHLVLETTSNNDLTGSAYDDESLTSTRLSLQELAKGIDGYDRAFGSPASVDPVRHLLGTAAAWGGLPQEEAYYVNVHPNLPVGHYPLTIPPAVPVDAFWSISVYNEAGYFEENDAGRHSVNSITGSRNEDGSITVNFGGDPQSPNCLPIMAGWNYIVRLYRPHREVLEHTWTFPSIEP